MANIQKDILFDHFISGMEKEMQATLRMMYLNSCNIDEANRRREMEEMKEAIVQDVLSHISATVDASEIFDAIDGLNEKVEIMHHRREGRSLPAVPIEKEKTENAEHSTKSTADSHTQRTRRV